MLSVAGFCSLCEDLSYGVRCMDSTVSKVSAVEEFNLLGSDGANVNNGVWRIVNKASFDVGGSCLLDVGGCTLHAVK